MPASKLKIQRKIMHAAPALFLIAAFQPTHTFALDSEIIKAAQKTFKKCRACHEVGPDAKNKVGPTLNGLNGRQFGLIEGFKYSKVFKKAAEEGRNWDAESLDGYLKKPRAYLKGTKMSFSGLKKEKDRGNLIAWLFTFDAEGNELVKKASLNENDTKLLGASAAALEGDPEFGEYLSGECVTCHRLSGDSDGIPSIVNWPKENFIHALYEYKNDLRKNPVMQTMSKRLSDEEMAALAAYFKDVTN